MRRLLLGFSLSAVVFASAPARTRAESPREARPTIEMTDEGWRIHREALVFDGHNDLPWKMREEANSSFDAADIRQEQAILHTDLPRLRKGNVGAQYWAAYAPADTMKTGTAAKVTLEQIDLIQRMVHRYPDALEMAGTADDIERIHAQGKIACLIGIEGGHSIENSLALLRVYHSLGVRYMTLTHSDTLAWADSATDDGKSGGLSPFGEEVVRTMNRLGMLVDISHVSPETMHDALDLSKAPIIASHSSARAIAEHPRNVPDDVLKRLPQNGGVIMINFFSGFIVPEGAALMRDMFAVRRELRAKHKDDREFDQALKLWEHEHPIPAGTVHDVVDHIERVIEVAGIDHVGLGSDFDGVSQLPAQLESVAGYPFITQELLNRGYSESDIKKILGGNALRALREAERVSREMSKREG